MLYFCSSRSFFLSYSSLLRILVPGLLDAELMGSDPVVLALHHVLGPVAVQLRAQQPRQLRGDRPHKPCVPQLVLQAHQGRGHYPGVVDQVLQHHSPVPVPRGHKK